METHQALERLSTLPLVAALDPDAWAAVAGAVSSVRYEPGQLIVQQGEPADSLLLVVSGEIAILQDRRLTRLAPAPCVLGLQSLLQEGDRTASLEAATVVELLVLPRAVCCSSTVSSRVLPPAC